MVRILGQKHCLDIPYESLNFIFLGDKIFLKISRFGKNLETCSNLTCYA